MMMVEDPNSPHVPVHAADAAKHLTNALTAIQCETMRVMTHMAQRHPDGLEPLLEMIDGLAVNAATHLSDGVRFCVLLAASSDCQRVMYQDSLIEKVNDAEVLWRGASDCMLGWTGPIPGIQ